MTINYIKDVGFSESKLLLPVFLLLMASFYACNSKKEAVPQTVVSEPDEPQNTAITLYLQPYNGFPEEQILKLRANVQNCLCYICDADKHPQLEKEVRLCPVCKEYLLSLFE